MAARAASRVRGLSTVQRLCFSLSPNLRGLVLQLRAPAGLKELRCVHEAKQLYQAGDHSRPSGLMAGTQARSVVPVEVLVKQDVVAPVRIGLELPRAAVHGPAT